jgi:peptide/nickel transport system substrate-binding protein
MKWRVFGVLFPVVLIAALVYLILKPKPVNDKPQEDKPVIYAGSDDPGTVDPQAIDWGEQARVATNVFETLVRFGKDPNVIEPLLATEWKSSADKKVWDFTLRSGVKFHDGSDFNADAVVFAYSRFNAKDPFAPKEIPYASNFSDIEKIEAVSPTHVRFTLKSAGVIFLKNLAMFCCGVPSPTALKANPTGFGQKPSGTGPYRLTEWVKDQKIVLERFDGYWGKRPSIGKAVIIPVRDAPVRIQKLLDGQIHILDNVSAMDVEVVRKNPAFVVGEDVSMNICYLGFNMDHAPYSNPDFRKAVAMAIDKKKLNELGYFGKAEIARSILPPSIWGHDPEAPEPALDREKAKELLAKISNLPEVELYFPSYSRPYVPDPDKVAQSIQADLKAIGLNVKIQSFPRDSYSANVHKKDHPMFLLGWSTDNADPDNFLYALLHGDSIPNNGTNGTFFNHPEFDELTKRAQSEVDEAKRKELYIKAQRIYKEQIPSIPLVHVKPVVAHTSKLKYNQHPLEVRLTDLEWVK